jgi:enamine deaminase RidA (YjgF/YER057c/UK114 family)
MNGVWERWILPGAAPARATVLSPKLAGSAYKIEIGIIAARD